MNSRLDAEGAAAMVSDIKRRQIRPNFANAGSIRNALDRARRRQTRRRFDSFWGVVDREALETVKAEDIRASRVFSEDAP